MTPSDTPSDTNPATADAPAPAAPFALLPKDGAISPKAKRRMGPWDVLKGKARVRKAIHARVGRDGRVIVEFLCRVMRGEIEHLGLGTPDEAARITLRDRMAAAELLLQYGFGRPDAITADDVRALAADYGGEAMRLVVEFVGEHGRVIDADAEDVTDAEPGESERDGPAATGDDHGADSPAPGAGNGSA